MDRRSFLGSIPLVSLYPFMSFSAPYGPESPEEIPEWEYDWAAGTTTDPRFETPPRSWEREVKVLVGWEHPWNVAHNPIVYVKTGMEGVVEWYITNSLNRFVRYKGHLRRHVVKGVVRVVFGVRKKEPTRWIPLS